jgi:hypothetical protein
LHLKPDKGLDMSKKDKTDQNCGIYALKCPADNSIKYIGQSKNIAKRYKAHCELSESKKIFPVVEWVMELKEKGLKPVLEVLEVVSEPKERDAAEIKWIDSVGLDNLLNVIGGGRTEYWKATSRVYECWSVDGLKDPYAMLRGAMFAYRLSNQKIKALMQDYGREYRSLKTERERVEFQLRCFNVLQKLDGKYYRDAEEWLSRAAKQINSVYKGRVVIKLSNGDLITP